MSIILQGLKIPQAVIYEQFSTIHNYIDTESMILRKGAVSAKLGEKLIIPINMRDGSLICEGLGNRDWNYSAPHGAGRIMSRTQAFEVLKMEDYAKAMKGIYSTSVNKKTLDESPMAYKDMKNIIENIKPTAKLLKIIKPIYNYKAAEEKRKWKY
jgi:RNA-splicing ligase RtcB